MKLVRIREAKPLDGHRVQLTLTDGRVINRDLTPLLAGPIFDEIRTDRHRFEEMHVEGGTLVWPNGADLCPDTLVWGYPPRARLMPPPNSNEIKTAATDVAWEYVMLLGAALEIAKAPGPPFNHILQEVFLTHARNLAEFFCGG